MERIRAVASARPRLLEGRRPSGLLWILVALLMTACAQGSDANLAVHQAGPRVPVGATGTAAPSGVLIGTRDDALAIVARHRPGTTFVFDSGVHRLDVRIEPRDGDRFVGRPGAILSGAVVLKRFERDGDLWVARLEGDRNPPHGECRTEAPRCDHPEDLFYDDAPLAHVASKADVVPGTWFFDYGGERVYLADDPDGARVEVSVAFGAFYGVADDVTIENLVIEKFATRAQTGAIHAYRNDGVGQRWLVRHNVVRLNHSVGIKVGYGSRVVGNLVHHNGQLGVASVGGVGSVFEDNEVSFNNFAGFDNSWEAGGSKFVDTTGLIVRHNHVHHNDGPGLWTDIDNRGTLYERNHVENNVHTGIFHEISYDAEIRYNLVVGNGFGRGFERYCYVHCAGIFVYASSDVTVHGNVVLGNWNGITGRYGGRGAGAYGPYLLTDLYVHDNVVEMLYHPEGISYTGGRGIAGVSGVAADDPGDDAFSLEANNRFEANTYYAARSHHFMWLGTLLSFESWQVCGGLTNPWPGCRHDEQGELHRGLAPAAPVARP